MRCDGCPHKTGAPGDRHAPGGAPRGHEGSRGDASARRRAPASRQKRGEGREPILPARGTKPAVTAISDLQPPELRQSAVSFKPLGSWLCVTAARANGCRARPVTPEPLRACENKVARARSSSPKRGFQVEKAGHERCSGQRKEDKRRHSFPTNSCLLPEVSNDQNGSWPFLTVHGKTWSWKGPWRQSPHLKAHRQNN